MRNNCCVSAVKLERTKVSPTLLFSGTRNVSMTGGAGQTLVFDGIPVRASGRHLLLASAYAGDATEAMLGVNVEGICSA